VSLVYFNQSGKESSFAFWNFAIIQKNNIPIAGPDINSRIRPYGVH